MRSLAFSPDGALLASGYEDGSFGLLDVSGNCANGERYTEIGRDSESILSLAFAGPRHSKETRLWVLSTGRVSLYGVSPGKYEKWFQMAVPGAVKLAASPKIWLF